MSLCMLDRLTFVLEQNPGTVGDMGQELAPQFQGDLELLAPTHEVSQSMLLPDLPQDASDC